MKNKKLVAAVAAVCLVAVMGVGATLAYFSSVTEAVTNTFTVGNVKIDVKEPHWDPEDGKNLQPGASVEKDPVIVNTGAADGYVMMQVSGMDDMAALGFHADFDAANWTLVDENGNKIDTNGKTDLQDGFYVYNSIVAKGATTKPLFERVTFDTDASEITSAKYIVVAQYVAENGELISLDDKTTVPTQDANGQYILKYTIDGVDGKVFDSYEEAEAYVMENYSEEAAFVFDLKITGYAIQTLKDSDGNDVEPTANTTEWVPELVELAK